MIGGLIKSLHGIRLVGLANVMRAIQNARYRDRLDAMYLRPLVYEEPIERGHIISVEPLSSGAHVHFEKGELSILFLMEDLVFIAWDGALMAPSFAVVHQDWGEVSVALSEIRGGWQVQSRLLSVEITSDGRLSFLDQAGCIIRQEEPPRWMGSSWSHHAILSQHSCIYGLGERGAGLNLRPGCYRLWNTDAGGSYKPGEFPLYITMPVYLCMQLVGSYLAFYDNTFDGTVTFDERIEVTFSSGPARYYLAVGEPANLMERLTRLTGRPLLPPRWAFGYQQSQWGYGTEDEMRRIYAGFKKHKLPLSVFYLDIDHLRGYRTLTVDETRYPALADFAHELARDDVHLVAITNPGVKLEPDFELYINGLKEDVFCRSPDGAHIKGVVWPGWTVFPDFTSSRVCQWWGRNYVRHLQHGIDGFWHDMNEPQSFVAWGDPTLPLATQHDLDGQGGDHREIHNVYGLLMNRAGYEGLTMLQPQKRPFLLSRSGWVGMQRYCWTWTGDVKTTWQALRRTIPTVLGLGLCGMPYDGADIGGFSGMPTPELFVRWFQLGATLPFFRTHSAFYLPRREPWEWGERILDILQEQLRLRYLLLPYWYTLAWIANKTGQPLVRPLFWAEPADPVLWEVDDSFLLGDALLVAPAVEEGAHQRKVRLPRGVWFDFYSDEIYKGGQVIEVDAPLERIPLLVRAGSILPTVDADKLTLHIYCPCDNEAGTGLLYSDAGDGYGSWRLDRFRLTTIEHGAYLFDWTVEGEFEWPYSTIAVILHGFKPDRILVNGKESRLSDGGCMIPILAQLIIHSQ